MSRLDFTIAGASRRFRSGASFLCIAVLIAVPILGFRHIFDGSDSFFISYDNVEQFYPWYQKLSEAVHRGYLPIWDANALSGHSFVGEFQTGVFYPVNILWVAIFGTTTGIGITSLEFLVILHFIAASVFAFLLARRLQFSFAASTVTGILYGYSGDFAQRASGQTCIFFGNTYIPLAILFTIMSVDRRQLRYAAFAGICVGLQALAGHLEPPSIGALLVLAVLLIDFARQKRLQFSLRASLLVVLSAGAVSSPQLLFGFQYLSHAYRWVASSDGPIHGTARLPFNDYAASGFTPYQFLNVFDPRIRDTPDGNILFIGCLPLIVLAIGLANAGSRRSAVSLMAKVTAITILAGFALLMLLGSLTPIPWIVYHVPYASAAVRELGRYAIIIQLLMVLWVGAAMTGLDSATDSSKDMLRKPIVFFAIVLCVAYVGFFFSIPVDGQVVGGVALLGVLAIVVLRSSYRTATLLVLIAVEVIVELPAMAKPSSFSTYPPKRFAMNALLEPTMQCYPACRLAILDDVFPANIGDVYAIQTIYGKGATMYEPYYDLLGAGGFDPYGFVEDALNVRFIISGHKLAGFHMLAKLDNPERYLYERPNVFPRIYSLSALEKRDRKLNDVKFEVVHYADLDSEFLVTVPRAETIVFAEQFYPGWVVSIDNQPSQMLAVPIVGSKPILRAVALEAGMHRIRFDYPR